MVTPLSVSSASSDSGDEEITGGKLWTGSADGTVFAWADPEGGGMIDEAAGTSYRLEGGRGMCWAVWGGRGDNYFQDELPCTTRRHWNRVARDAAQ